MKHYLLVNTFMDGALGTANAGTTILAETDIEAVRLALRVKKKLYSWTPFHLFDISTDEMREIPLTLKVP